MFHSVATPLINFRNKVMSFSELNWLKPSKTSLNDFWMQSNEVYDLLLSILGFSGAFLVTKAMKNGKPVHW